MLIARCGSVIVYQTVDKGPKFINSFPSVHRKRPDSLLSWEILLDYNRRDE